MIPRIHDMLSSPEEQLAADIENATTIQEHMDQVLIHLRDLNKRLDIVIVDASRTSCDMGICAAVCEISQALSHLSQAVIKLEADVEGLRDARI